VQSGAFDWIVRSVVVFERTPQPPGLGHYAEERGTHDPTKYAEGVRQRWQELVTRDPTTTWNAFAARLNTVYVTFNAAWTARDLASMRPFLSDALFSTQQYWIEAYRAQGMRNVIEHAQITRTELVKVETDAFFDAITVRIFAQGIDYTVRENGSYLSGNQKVPRQYSEYWTFIRGRERKGAARADKQCPNCGAPLAVDMVGTCTYCRVKVTGGTFDWTLSRIEQDESYVG
jgi:predicted lipid-binding transport protein (Tim44 family)